MTRGIRHCAAVFLLEACVVLAIGSQWAGSWTQRLYGTGTADIWEVGTVHEKITRRGYLEGWMVLEPSAYIHDRNYIDVTLAERSPRLVLVETLGKMWSAVHATESSKVHSARQRAKQVREVSNVF